MTKSAPKFSPREIIASGWAESPVIAIDSFENGTEEQRAASLGALHRHNELPAARVIVALNDTDLVTERALRVCAHGASHGEPLVEVDTLAEQLVDRSPSVIELCCFAIGEHDTVSANTVSVLCNLAETSSERLVRESAVAALGAIGDVAALDTILLACRDTSSVRRRAVLGLANFEDPKADAMLSELCSDRDHQVRQAAEDLSGLRP